MAKNQKQQAYEVTPTDRLGMRVSAMINSPKAQELGKVTIHRLDSDPAEAWDAVMEVLAETDGIDLVFNDDGTVTLRWDRQELEGEGGNEKPRSSGALPQLFLTAFRRSFLAFGSMNGGAPQGKSTSPAPRPSRRGFERFLR